MTIVIHCNNYDSNQKRDERVFAVRVKTHTETTDMGRVVRFHRLGGSKVLQIEDLPDRGLKASACASKPLASIAQSRMVKQVISIG